GEEAARGQPRGSGGVTGMSASSRFQFQCKRPEAVGRVHPLATGTGYWNWRLELATGTDGKLVGLRPPQGAGNGAGAHTMLKIENLHVRVAGRDILKGLSLEVSAGEVHAIMGPN